MITHLRKLITIAVPTGTEKLSSSQVWNSNIVALVATITALRGERYLSEMKSALR